MVMGVLSLGCGVSLVTPELTGTAVASAQQAPASGARVVSRQHIVGNYWKIRVWSPANKRVIVNNVLLPAGDQPRSTLYLLPGLEGGMQGQNWITHSDVEQFFAGKNVNVVMPLGGAHSLYTDWQQRDPILGINKWNTYMAEELPSVMDREFHGNGRDAIAGLSSTGAAALDIAGHAPHRFKAAASYSGCPIRSSGFGLPVSAAMMLYGGGNPLNAWGMPGSDAWRDHDPNANPARLRGVNVFLASASGTPGPIDGPVSSSQWGGPRATEIVANECTRLFAQRARAYGVNVNRYYTSTGSHSFPLFAHQLKVSWAQTIAPTLDLS